MWQQIQNFCWYVGAFYLLAFLISTLKRFLIRQKDLYKRYGGGWAVVTGGTDGIGLGYCEELAKRKFNICIVSRTKSKLEKVAASLEEKFNIKTKILVADFCQGTNKQFYEELFKQIQELDISVLVNNVGWMIDVGLFCTHSYEELSRELQLNLFPIALLSHKIIPRMMQRATKSGIINLASTAIYANLKYSANYCSTKAYDDIFSRSLEYQFGHKIDFLSVRPALVTTPLTRGTQSFLHVNKNQCAGGSLRCLGNTSTTSGHWWHQVQALPMDIFPESIRDFLMGNIQEKQGDKYRAVDESRNK